MPLYTADALVLRTYKLGESDRIVVFLTRDRGKKRGVAKGARRPRSKFVGALEPMTRARIAYFEKERRDLVSLNYADIERSPLAAGGESLGHVGYFAELLDEWAAENDPNERLFRLGSAVTEAMAAAATASAPRSTDPTPRSAGSTPARSAELTIDALARYFVYWLLKLEGVYPSHTTCHQCGAALDGDGAFLEAGARVFTCAACAPTLRIASGIAAPNLSRPALTFLRDARTTPAERVGDLRLSAAASRELESVHRALIATHLEKELRSVRVLREMRR
jgi:DNA repair protein RecO (recombination protein O)